MYKYNSIYLYWICLCIVNPVTVYSDNKQSKIVVKYSKVTVGTVNSKCGNNHFKHRIWTKMLDGKVYVRLSLCNAVYAQWGDVCICDYF